MILKVSSNPDDSVAMGYTLLSLPVRHGTETCHRAGCRKGRREKGADVREGGCSRGAAVLLCP